jgi:hypothetical protein
MVQLKGFVVRRLHVHVHKTTAVREDALVVCLGNSPQVPRAVLEGPLRQ